MRPAPDIDQIRRPDIRSSSPRTVKVAKMDGKVLDDQVIRSVDVYMICYF